jgi:post-segregation antitoxin (ccd killing protein)
MANAKIWQNSKPASFEIEGFERVVFPVWRQVEGDGGIREVSRSVPWIDGEEIDETGLRANTWNVTAPFYLPLQAEDGIGEDPPLYPTRMEKLIELFEAKKTGTLHLPWKRNIRCKAITWRRVASDSEIDGEVLTITFKCDNENLLDQQKAQSIPASTVRQLAIQAQFEAERTGAWNGSWEDLTRLTSRLEAIMAAPSEYRQDVASKAQRVSSCCDRLLAAHQKSEAGQNQFLDPVAAPAVRLLMLIRGQADSAEGEARTGTIQGVVTKTTERVTSIWEFAIAAGMDPYEMLTLNPQIEDPNYIPAGTQIKTARV